MFEELNQHRAAVAEQIQKACEIGFTGGDLEKAHKVGDIHPNGKWVWTQLPSGRYDWRVIKRTSGGSAPAAPATAQKKPISVSANHPALSGVAGVDNVKEYLTTFNSKYTDLSKVILSRTPKGNWDVRYDGHRLGILNGDQIPESSVKKMGWMEKTEASGSAVKMPASYEEAVKMGRVDTAKVNAYKMPTTMHQAKFDLETYRGGTGRYNNMYGAIEVAENDLRRALNRRVTNDSLGYKSEKEKIEAVQAAADKLATEKAIEKRISKIYADLNKMKKDFLANTKYDFSEKEISEWLEKYNTAREPAAVVRNTWNYSMGRIGSTSATIQVGSSKEKPFSTSRWDGTVPSWRPIGIMSYSVKIYGYGNQPTTYEKVEIPIQSWDDVQKHLSDTESYSIYLYKHPKQ